MRQIFLDTETTGLNPKVGNRIIEIGCVELLHRQRSGNNLHFYLNPERDSEEGALAVHGLTTEFLKDKPKFKEVVAELLDYIQGADVFIHNAAFDVGFLNAELIQLGFKEFQYYVSSISDTLQQAKELHPGKRNSLDALCDRYGISNAHRTLHGALLDAELLAEVYLAMSRGQSSLSMELIQTKETSAQEMSVDSKILSALKLSVASDEEISAHNDVLNDIQKEAKGNCVWLKEE